MCGSCCQKTRRSWNLAPRPNIEDPVEQEWQREETTQEQGKKRKQRELRPYESLTGETQRKKRLKSLKETLERDVTNAISQHLHSEDIVLNELKFTVAGEHYHVIFHSEDDIAESGVPLSDLVRMNGVEGRKEYNDELTLFNLSERRVQEGEEDKGKPNRPPSRCFARPLQVLLRPFASVFAMHCDQKALLKHVASSLVKPGDFEEMRRRFFFFFFFFFFSFLSFRSIWYNSTLIITVTATATVMVTASAVMLSLVLILTLDGAGSLPLLSLQDFALAL